jgi:hypothetical protein
MRKAPTWVISVYFLLVGFAGGLAACEAGAPDAPSVSELSLVPVAEVGPEMHGGQIGTGGFAISPAGDLAVIDPGERHLVVVPASGDPPIVLGRRGSGPGEFMGPRLVATSDHGIVAVYDRALRRLSFWDAREGLLEERVLARSVWAMRGDGDGVLVKVGREGVSAEDGGFGIVRVRPGSEEETLFESGRGLPLEGSISPGAPLPQVCSVCPFFRTVDDRWIFQPAGWGDQVVLTNENGEVDLVWSRGREPTPLSDEEWLAERRRFHEASRARAEDLTPALAAVYPEFNPETSAARPLRRGLSDRGAVGLDGRGRLWTLPSLPPDSLPRLEVHAPDGTFLGAVPLDERPVRFDVRGDRVALVFEDELGLARVRILTPPAAR